MALLATHISTFLILFPVGLRRLSSTTTTLLHSPTTSSFLARPWYNTSSSTKLDLYTLLFLLPISSLCHLFLFLDLHSFPLTLLSFVPILFFLLLLLHWIALVPDELIFFVGTLVFLGEYGISVVGEKGIEGRLGEFSSAVTIVCAGACLVLAVRRSAVAADFTLGMGVAMKGTWALQMGLTLYAIPPRGCHTIEDSWGELECELMEDVRRGVALVELLFSMHVVGIATCCMGMYWVIARREIRTANSNEAMINRPVRNSNEAMIIRPIMTSASSMFELE